MLEQQSFSASDDITGEHLDVIQTRLQAETAVPEGFLTAVQTDKLLVYLLDVNNNIPRLSSCIVVHSDLRVTVSLIRLLFLSLIINIYYHLQDVWNGYPS